MMNQENKHLLTAYIVTIAVAALLLVVIINFNRWFFPDTVQPLSEFTPTARGVVSEQDLKFDLLGQEKFRSLSPLVSEAELKRLEEEAAAAVTPGSDGTVPTGTVKPSVRPRREVRHSNPFSPF